MSLFYIQSTVYNINIRSHYMWWQVLWLWLSIVNYRLLITIIHKPWFLNPELTLAHGFLIRGFLIHKPLLITYIWAIFFLNHQPEIRLYWENSSSNHDSSPGLGHSEVTIIYPVIWMVINELIRVINNLKFNISLIYDIRYIYIEYHYIPLLVGGFNPSEKYESQLGLLFPIYGNIWKIK